MLNPWAIYVGLAAAALPVAIHFLTRPRPTRYPLSTLRFVREAVRQQRTRHRLRDWLVLALRSLAVFLIAATIARPLTDAAAVVSISEGGSTTRIVILDVSQSLAAADRGVRGIERARTAAAQYLDYRAGLNANLLLAGARPRAVFDRPSMNFGALREELDRCQAEPQRLSVKAALEMAAQMLAESPTEHRRELVMVSDFQRTNWATADFAVCPEDTHIQLESVAPAEPPANLAILRAGCRGRSSQGKEVQLEVEVGNFSPQAARVRVDVTLGDMSCQLEGVCAANARTTVSQAIVLRGLGWQTGEARLAAVDDALPMDDARPVVLEVRPAATYAIITRQPASERLSSSYFLESALAPQEGGPKASKPRVVRVDSSQLDRDVLSAADLIALDHPGKLPRDAERMLAALLRRGRPILYVASELIDATNLKLLTDAAGAELQLPVEFTPPPAGQPRRELFLTEVKSDESPFRVFGDAVTTVVGPLRFSGGLSSRRIEGALADDVLATYSDRSAFLVHTSSGAGSLAVLNADLAGSNLRKSPAFVPLLGELVERLLEHNQTQTAAISGEPLAAFLPGEAGTAAGLKALGPGGVAVADAALSDEGIGVMWRMPAAGPPGVYQVKREAQTVFALASTIAEEESDLRTLPPDVFQERLSGGRKLAYRSATEGHDQRDDWWTFLAVACVICLALELVALRAFRT